MRCSPAAHHLRSIAANDDRPRTRHAEAQQTDRELLPDIIGRVLDRHDQRLSARASVWHKQVSAAQAFRAAYEGMVADIPSAARAHRVGGLEL
jgi:hypothetical protein